MTGMACLTKCPYCGEMVEYKHQTWELLDPDGTWKEVVYKDLGFDKDPIIYNAMISDCMEHNYYLQEDKEAHMIHVFRTKK